MPRLWNSTPHAPGVQVGIPATDGPVPVRRLDEPDSACTLGRCVYAWTLREVDFVRPRRGHALSPHAGPGRSRSGWTSQPDRIGAAGRAAGHARPPALLSGTSPYPRSLRVLPPRPSPETPGPQEGDRGVARAPGRRRAERPPAPPARAYPHARLDSGFGPASAQRGASSSRRDRAAATRGRGSAASSAVAKRRMARWRRPASSSAPPYPHSLRRIPPETAPEEPRALSSAIAAAMRGRGSSDCRAASRTARTWSRRPTCSDSPLRPLASWSPSRG